MTRFSFISGARPVELVECHCELVGLSLDKPGALLFAEFLQASCSTQKRGRSALFLFLEFES